MSLATARGLCWSAALAFAAAVALAGAAAGGRLPALRDGDVIFQTSRSSQSEAIRRATRSPYSHMGVVFYRGGRPFVLEAGATVRFTRLDAWVARGQGQHFVVRRLRNAGRILTAAALDRLRAQAQKFEGRPYDLVFSWSDDRIYCSELVWKAYDRALGIRLGGLQELRDLDLSEPVVRARLRERYGSDVPLHEPVITPAAIFRSGMLFTACAR